jgi:hypothetical protein
MSTTPPTCWTNTSTFNVTRFTLENTGNNYVNVTINSTTATTFLGDPTGAGISRYQWAASDNSSGLFQSAENGCIGTLSSASDWTNFTNADQLLCTNMSPDLSTDAFVIDINITIPAGITGNKTADVIFLGEKSAQ